MDTNSLKHWALKRAEHWWAKLNNAHDTAAVIPRIIFSDKMVSTAGRAHHGTVKLSTHFLKNELTGYDITIAHELCHIFADWLYGRRCRHDFFWQGTMHKIGLSADRCHKYKSTVKRQGKKQERTKIRCRCGSEIGVTVTVIRRMLGGRKYRCIKCKFELNQPMIAEYQKLVIH